MKNVLAMILTLSFSAQAWAMNIDPTHSGSWYKPSESGHGLSVEVLDAERTIIYWYVYDPEGNPIFLVTSATNNGNRASGTTYYFSGMRFGEFDPNDNEQEVWGTSTFIVNSCSSATLNYNSNDPAYGSGTIQMSRLASIQGVKCTDNPLQNFYHLTLVEGSQVGFGAMQVFENGFTTTLALGDHGGSTGMGVTTERSGNLFELQLQIFDISAPVSREYVITGEYSEGYISGSFNGGSLVGTEVASFQQETTYNQVAGTYTLYDATQSQPQGSVTFGTDGSLGGQMTTGCSVSGEYIIPDQQFNQIAIEIYFNGCAEEASLIGAGNVGADESLFFATHNGLKGFVLRFDR